jgi:hypothetical protein
MTAKSKTCPVCGGEDRFYFHYTAEHPHWRCRACQYTAEPTGEDLEGKPDRDPLTPEQQQQARAAYATVATYCADKLWTPEGKPARDYLHQRGFTDETLKAAGIGWHHDDRRNGVALDLWREHDSAYEGARLAGLTGKQGVQNRVLQGTITLPYLHNQASAVATLRGRVLHRKSKDDPKYYSPAGEMYAGATPVFYLHDVLDTSDAVILTEGEFKALMVFQEWRAGNLSMPAVATPSGAYLPQALVKALKDHTVYLCYDSDQAGQRFTDQARRKLRKAGIQTRVIRWPEHDSKQDIDGFILQNGAAAFQELIDTADGRAINITDENLGRTTDAIWDAMLQSSYAGALYRYGSEIAYLNGRLTTLDDSRWRGIVNRVASFEKWKETKHGIKVEEVLPPLAMIRDSLLFAPDLPAIDRVSAIPVFDRAGQLLTNGYHADSRILVHTDLDTDPMSPEQARALLEEMLCDFPFSSEADKANTFAYLFAPFVREMCGSIPLFLLDAAQRGTGKTLLNDLIHTIWTGENAPLSDLPLNAEEQRKQLTTHLMHGPASVVFDDISLLQGNAIQRAVTGHTWSDRLLGKNEEISVPIRAIFSATGNNVTLGGDMVRRVVLIRLESSEENPSQRSGFKRSESELRLWVQDHRADLVRACIALVHHGLVHGTPGTLKMGGFDRFARVMSTVLHGIGAPGFYDNMQQTFEREDSRQSGWKAIVWQWWEVHRADLVRPRDIAHIIETDTECDIFLEGDSDKARDTAAGMLLRRKVGTVFSYEAVRLRIDQKKDNRGKNRYCLVDITPKPDPEPKPDPSDAPDTPEGGGQDIPRQEAVPPPSPPSPPRDCPAQHTHTHTRARTHAEQEASLPGGLGGLGGGNASEREMADEANHHPPAEDTPPVVDQAAQLQAACAAAAIPADVLNDEYFLPALEAALPHLAGGDARKAHATARYKVRGRHRPYAQQVLEQLQQRRQEATP